MRCILVDDESLARERLKSLLADCDMAVEVVGEAGGGLEAIPLIYEKRPDLIFLDIQMPILDGFEVVQLLAPPRPQIIFVTAFDQHALKAFEVHALDYLTKPVRLQRLNEALNHVKQLGIQQQQDKLDQLNHDRSDQNLKRLTVQVGRRMRVINLEDIRFFEANEKQVYVYLNDGRYITNFTLDALELRLEVNQFIRIHRAFMVQANLIHELLKNKSGHFVVRLKDGKTLPVARRRVVDVRSRLGGK